jgi:hypothetical protein
MAPAPPAIVSPLAAPAPIIFAAPTPIEAILAPPSLTIPDPPGVEATPVPDPSVTEGTIVLLSPPAQLGLPEIGKAATTPAAGVHAEARRFMSATTIAAPGMRFAEPARLEATSSPHRRTAERTPPPLPATPFTLDLSTAAASAGAGGSGGIGVAAALALWLLFQFPGIAVLRRPPRRRAPRARVDDIRNRPG